VPPPTRGTIIVTKHVAAPPDADMTFPFQGNISYNADGRFQLTVTDGADASMTFYRAATGATDPPWTVAELVPSGWSLTGLVCSSSLGSTTTRNPNKPEEVSIRLVGADTVRCTFTDAQSPLASQLLISKVTTGGVDTFPFTVHDVGGVEVLRTTATTTSPDVAVLAKDSPQKLDPGTYTVGESLPDANGGHWVQTAVNCNATRTRTRRGRAAPPPVEVKITADKGQVCVFENRFVPTGSITITKSTLGATGTTSFTVTSVAQPGTQYVKTATTTEPGEPALAVGDPTSQLALGRYVIQEHRTVSDDDGDWVLQAVNCGGVLRPFEQGQVVVQLTAQDPHEVCRFVNQFVPPEPGSPEPTPPLLIDPGSPAAPPKPDIVVTKRALRSTVRLGSILAYKITVRNAGPVPAHDVVVSDAPGRSGQIVSAQASRADCDQRVPVACRIGTLGAGQQVTIRVRLRAIATGRMRNLAVAGSGTDEVRLANNVALTRVRVSGAHVIGRCSKAGPRAHAAC
jgi:uncharacterized repeat protein (TIGR01451 family)